MGGNVIIQNSKMNEEQLVTNRKVRVNECVARLQWGELTHLKLSAPNEVHW